MKAASIEAVKWPLDNPGASASAQHDQWAKQERETGWGHGKVKDGVKKTHPMLVPCGDLPEVERHKDALIKRDHRRAGQTDALAKCKGDQ